VTSTEALGTAAPLGSTTLPIMFPKTAWAKEIPAKIRNKDRLAENNTHFRDKLKNITRLPGTRSLSNELSQHE
jgi:hypothetical protein